MDSLGLELAKLIEKLGVTVAMLIYFIVRDWKSLNTSILRDTKQTESLTQIAERLDVIVNKLDEGGS